MAHWRAVYGLALSGPINTPGSNVTLGNSHYRENLTKHTEQGIDMDLCGEQ